jgi:B12-binding domain/radical SAM domain protein
VCIRLTRHNRNSVAALMAVLEQELSRDLPDLRLASNAEEVVEGSLAIYSFMTPQADRVRQEVARIRERHGQGVHLLAGGPHANGDPEGTLAMGFHWVALGEAGASFARIVRDVVSGVLPPPGVLPSAAAGDLDQYDPWPASGRLFAQVEITRGCPMGCAFCQTPALFGRRPRHRSLGSIERLLRASVDTGHRFTRFIAPDAFAYGSEDGRRINPRAVESLLRLARDCGLQKVFFGTFPSEVRPESATPDMLRMVHDLCDNRNLSVGLQSGSDGMLRRLRRGHTVRQGIDAVANMARAGFVPRVDFIFGLPKETDEDRRATREVIEHVTSCHGARVHAHVFTPLPGTALWAEAPSPVDEETRRLVEALRGKGLASGHPTDRRRLPRHLLRMAEGRLVL